MQLQYKPDFAEVLERFEAWWRCEIVDRPLLTINIERERPLRDIPEKTHASLREQWLDMEHKLDRFKASLDGEVFLAETLPCFMPDVGPDVCATVFGCDLEFGESTSWSSPIAASCREIPNIQPSFDGVYWNAIRDGTDLSLERGAGKWLTALPDLHSNGDLLAALRGPQELCFDCADDIESVRSACDYVTTHCLAMYEDIYARLASVGQPNLTWIPALHAGRMYSTSCDFICMISPEMFGATILPSIIREIEYLDRTIFHLDGPGALVHLDALLAIDRLNGLQWVYGAGSEPSSRWIEVYTKAQAAGKCLQMFCEDLDDARAVAEHLRPEGVWFWPMGRYPRDEAEAFVKWLERWAAGKR